MTDTQATPGPWQLLRECERMLRTLGREFTSPRFTDRHGYGPEVLGLAERVRAELDNAETAVSLPSGFKDHICGLSGLGFQCPACAALATPQDGA